MPTTLLSLALALAPGAAPLPAVDDAAALARGLATIEVGELRADVEVVASDAMGGRDTPSPGLAATADFLVARLEALGLSPGARGGGFRHRWPRAWRQADADACRLEVEGALAREELVLGRDYFLSRASELADLTAAGRVVCVGEGGSAELDAADLTGCWALARSSGASLRRLTARAQAAGAVGCLLLPEPGEDVEGRLGRTARYLLEGRFGERGEDVFPLLRLTADAARRVLAAGGRDALPAAGEPLGLAARETRRTAHPGGTLWLENVCALWPGSDPALAREVIVVSAHYDHVGTQDGVVFNGADDNASGTCGLLALAEALTEYGPLRRSVLLLWVSGEEKGLWGSEAWAKRPWLPPGMRPIADLNIDMIGRNAPDELLITPTRRLREHYNQLVQLAERFAPEEGFRRLGSADRYWRRSDHMNFALHLGLPVAFLFVGEHRDYHQPTDDPDALDYDKMRRVVRLVLRMLDGLQADRLELEAAPDLRQFEAQMRRGMALDDLEWLRGVVSRRRARDGGVWPQSLEGLEGLEDAPAADPWGREYGWAPPGEGRPGRLWTLGSDGAEGGEGEAQDLALGVG